ncbi:MAG: hypothetical protein HC813_02895, partial [Planctomycetes bacterium]|nr:hypothetical protein [Planctomycetota bacterium]
EALADGVEGVDESEGLDRMLAEEEGEAEGVIEVGVAEENRMDLLASRRSKRMRRRAGIDQDASGETETGRESIRCGRTGDPKRLDAQTGPLHAAHST